MAWLLGCSATSGPFSDEGRAQLSRKSNTVSIPRVVQRARGLHFGPAESSGRRHHVVLQSALIARHYAKGRKEWISSLSSRHCTLGIFVQNLQLAEVSDLTLEGREGKGRERRAFKWQVKRLTTCVALSTPRSIFFDFIGQLGHFGVKCNGMRASRTDELVDSGVFFYLLFSSAGVIELLKVESNDAALPNNRGIHDFCFNFSFCNRFLANFTFYICQHFSDHSIYVKINGRNRSPSAFRSTFVFVFVFFILKHGVCLRFTL